MHGLIAGRVRVLGPASVPGRLVELGDFPGLVAPASPDERVRGDLCELPHAGGEALLDALDRYEGPRFVRERGTVDGPDGASLAWLYRWLGGVRGRGIVPGGDFLEAARRRAGS